MRSKRQFRSWRAVVAVVAVLVAGWWFMSADAVEGRAGSPNAASQLGMGESRYVGHAGLAARPVIATGLSPVASSGLRTSLFICVPPNAEAGTVGIVDSTMIDDFCDLTPVRGSTPLEAGPLAGYLVVEVTRTEVGPQRLCGIDVRYRDGWRWGRARAGAYDVLFDAGDDALEDPSAWPTCPGG